MKLCQENNNIMNDPLVMSMCKQWRTLRESSRIIGGSITISEADLATGRPEILQQRRYSKQHAYRCPEGGEMRFD